MSKIRAHVVLKVDLFTQKAVFNRSLWAAVAGKVGQNRSGRKECPDASDNLCYTEVLRFSPSRLDISSLENCWGKDFRERFTHGKEAEDLPRRQAL